MEESVRYGIDDPQSYFEWLWTSTIDDQGNVHMGPDRRFGVVGVTHQQHCLRAIRAALAADDTPMVRRAAAKWLAVRHSRLVSRAVVPST